MTKILFGVVASLILIGSAYLNAWIYGHGFRLSGQNFKILFFIFLLIPLCFAISTVFAFGGRIMPSVYTVLQVVAGFGFYLFLGALLLGLIYVIGVVCKFEIPNLVFSLVFTTAIIFSIVGLVQARFIKIVNYSISNQNIPDELVGKRAVLVADTHFGLVNHKKFSDKVVKKITALNPDFVLHAGDFYDGPKIDTAPLTESWKKLTERFPVFMAPGNHEEYGDYRGFLDSISSAGVFVLEDRKIEHNGFEIVGIKYRENSLAELSATDSLFNSVNISKDKFTILINHAPTVIEVAQNAGVDLQVSGHTHRGQFWPINYLVRMRYGEYIYGSNNYKDLQVVTTSGVGTASVPFRLFNTPELVVLNFTK